MATEGFGTKIAYSDTENGTYTNIAKLIDITPPTRSVKDIDVTNHDSSNVKEYQASAIKEGGEANCTLEYAKAQHNTLEGLLGTTKWFRFTYPDGSTHKAQGYIKSINVASVPLEDRMQSEVAIKITGAITFTAAA